MPLGRQTDSEATGSARPALVYFAKAPRPGSVKTRLCPPLTLAEAAGLYGAFLRDAVTVAPDMATFVYVWPGDGVDEVRALVPPGCILRAQRGDDLFTRMACCFEELFAEGYGPIVLRNTDSPALPRERVRQALQAANDGSLVVGPDHGGGYYLVALAAPCRDLFRGHVAGAWQALVAQARGLGLRVEVLPTEPDVDTFEDLLRLWRQR